MSIARSTPAQKPRGFARRIFITANGGRRTVKGRTSGHETLDATPFGRPRPLALGDVGCLAPTVSTQSQRPSRALGRSHTARTIGDSRFRAHTLPLPALPERIQQQASCADGNGPGGNVGGRKVIRPPTEVDATRQGLVE